MLAFSPDQAITKYADDVMDARGVSQHDASSKLEEMEQLEPVAQLQKHLQGQMQQTQRLLALSGGDDDQNSEIDDDEVCI
jgi:hypothetical protein